MQRSLNWIAATALALSLLAGCGGGGGGTPPNITAAAGGTVTSGDGRVTLVVPPGAAPRDMTVRIVSAVPESPNDIGVLAGSGYAIEGDGGNLNSAAEITLTLAPGAIPTATPNREQALGASMQGTPPCQPSPPLEYVFQYGVPTCVNNQSKPTIARLSRAAAIELDLCVLTAATSTLKCRVATLSPQTVGVLFDQQPPTVLLALSTQSITEPATLVATVTATDNKGVEQVVVAMWRDAGESSPPATAEFGFLSTPPYVDTRNFTAADNGIWKVRASARDKNGNVAFDPAKAVTVAIPVPPGADTTAPTVSLAASSTNASVGDTVALAASAADDVGVAKVEFYQGANLLGERTAAPYELTTAAFTNADVGMPQVFTARAFDAAGNNALSGPVTVTVSAVVSGDVYVNGATGSDAAAGNAAAPFKTLAKAFSVVGSGATVWLQNGAFTTVTEGTDMFTGRTVPAGGKLRAVNAGSASIGFALKFAASGSVIDAAFDMSANGTVSATAGDVLVSRPTWVKLGAAGTGDAIVASGSAKVAVDNGGQAGHAYFAAAGIARLATLSGSAELSVNGGTVDGLSGAGGGFMLGLGGDAKLTLNNVTWTNAYGAVVAPTAIDVNGSGGTVTLLNSSIDLTGAVDLNNGGNACVRLRGPAVTTTQLTLDGASLKACPGDAIQVRDGTPTIHIKNNSAIQSAGFHGLRSAIFGGGVAAPAVTVANSSFSSNGRSAIELLGGGTLGMTSSAVMFNGSALPHGGIRLLGAHAYTLTMRNSIVQNNIGDASSGGLVLQGNAASAFDLGTKASPGANNIKFGGAASTNLRVGVAAGVQVLAVGNTWTASAQSSDSLGRYNAASNPCGANPCTVSSGSGQNYAVTGGSLRLVDD